MIQLALQRDAARQHGADRWIYVGEDTSWRVRAEQGTLRGLPRVATGDLIEEASWRLRAPYIDWIGELSAVNASPEWWASELAAKNPFSLLYPRICALAAGRAALQRDASPALVVCSTAALLEQIARFCDSAGIAWTRTGGARGRRDWRPAARRALDLTSGALPRPLVERLPLALRRAVEDSPRYRGRPLGSPPPASGFAGERTALLFTWVDERSVVDGAYVDPHFGALPAMLGDAGWQVAYVARVLPSARSYAGVVAALGSTGQRFWFPEQLVDAADRADCERRARAFAPGIPDDDALDGVPVAALAREHVAQQRRSHSFALQQAALVRRVAETGVAPARVVLPFEGHAWEQAAVDAVHRHMPGTLTVGFDNVNFSRLALSLYPADSELDLRPFPDRIVTSGSTFERILTEEGFPAERVRGGCALRHARLVPGESKGTRVLVAGSIDAGQTFEMIEKAVSAFGDDPSRLIVKLHPAVDRELLMRWIDRLAGHERIEFSERPIGELLPHAVAMLYGYSVVCYEALAAGVQPVFVQAETFLDLDQLEPYPDLRRPARSPEQIRAAVAEAEARSGRKRRQWLERAHAAVAEALVAVEPGCVGAFVD